MASGIIKFLLILINPFRGKQIYIFHKYWLANICPK